MTSYIFDVETTGKTEPRIVQASLLPVDFDKSFYSTGLTLTSMFDPGKPIEYGAMAVHGITDHDVIGLPSSDTFTLPADTEYIIGYNVDYDWQCIGKPDVKRICTLALARNAWSTIDSHQLLALIYMLDSSLAGSLQ